MVVGFAVPSRMLLWPVNFHDVEKCGKCMPVPTPSVAAIDIVLIADTLKKTTKSKMKHGCGQLR